MVFEHIEKLKEQYTDKYVAVDESRPELQRFSGLIGRVKTVNMSGRALVEFDTWINNIGWYDIDVDFLKVVDEAEIQAKSAAAKETPKKQAVAKEPSNLEKSRESAGKAAPKPGGGMSTADILAAARGGTAPKSKQEQKLAEAKGEERPTETSGGQMSVADMLAAARSSDSGGGAKAAPAKKPAADKPAKPPAAKKDPAAMSVADMLAAARSSDGPGGAAAKAPEPGAEKPAAPKQPAADTPQKSAPPKKTSGGAETSGMTVEQMLSLARDQASGKAPPAAKPESPKEKPPAEEPQASAEEVATPQEEEPATAAPTSKVPAAAGDLPKDVDGIVAYCRSADG